MLAGKSRIDDGHRSQIDLFDENQSDLSSWTDFAIAQANAQKIHTDPKFQLSVLEGKGTSSYEEFKEVQPTPKYLDPFIDFLAGKLSDHAPQLPERSREMEVITNIKIYLKSIFRRKRM